MEEKKPHPPSASRIADARRSGMAPRPLLVGLAGGLTGLTLYLAQRAPALHAGLKQLLQRPLEAFSVGTPERALTVALAPVRALATEALLLAVVTLLFSGGALFVAQGPSFGFAGRRSRRFAEPESVRSMALLAGVVLVITTLSLVPDLLWVEPVGAASLLRRVLVRFALVLVVLAVIDASFARAAFFRALWLTRREQRDELREAYGSPELRAARERVRRELRTGGP